MFFQSLVRLAFDQTATTVYSEALLIVVSYHLCCTRPRLVLFFSCYKWAAGICVFVYVMNEAPQVCFRMWSSRQSSSSSVH